MPPRQQEPQEERGWFYYARMAGLIYLGSNIMNTVVNQLVGPKGGAPASAAVYDPSSPAAAAGMSTSATPAIGGPSQQQGSQGVAVPMWREGASLDMCVLANRGGHPALGLIRVLHLPLPGTSTSRPRM
jgi:hypothetical protein